MERSKQEDIFMRELDRRIDQLAAEFELDSYFVLGYLARTMHRIQRDMDVEDEQSDKNSDD